MEEMYQKLYEEARLLNMHLHRRISNLEHRLESPGIFTEDLKYGIGWSDGMKYCQRLAQRDSEIERRIQNEKRKKARERKEEEARLLEEERLLEEKRLQDEKLKEEEERNRLEKEASEKKNLSLEERLEAINRRKLHKKEDEKDLDWLERIFNLNIKTNSLSEWKKAKKAFSLKHHGDLSKKGFDSDLLAKVNSAFDSIFKNRAYYESLL